jgi:hypothetical protein
MKFTLLLFTLFTFLSTKSKCNKLKDGVYLVKHTSNNGEVDYRLTVVGEVYIIRVNDSTGIKGKVTWIDAGSLKLVPDETEKQDTTAFGKMIYRSFGHPFIEFKKTKGNKTFFRTTWTGNLDLTINEGYFLKVN